MRNWLRFNLRSGLVSKYGRLRGTLLCLLPILLIFSLLILLSAGMLETKVTAIRSGFEGEIESLSLALATSRSEVAALETRAVDREALIVDLQTRLEDEVRELRSQTALAEERLLRLREQEAVLREQEAVIEDQRVAIEQMSDRISLLEARMAAAERRVIADAAAIGGSSIWDANHYFGMILDGDVTTRWSSGGVAKPHSVEIHLARSRVITRFRLKAFVDPIGSQVRHFTLKAWQNEWIPVLTAEAANSGGWQVWNFHNTVSSRFYRLIIESSYSGLPQSSVWEVELLYKP